MASDFTPETFTPKGFSGGAPAGWTPPQPQTGDPAGWWARVGANIIDSIVLLALPLVFGGLTYLLYGEDAGIGVGLLAYFAGILLYAPIMLVTKQGQTLGKMATNIKVMNDNGESIGFGRALLRESVVKLIFSLLWPLGLLSVLWPVWESRNRALHDLTVGSRVVRA